MPEDPDSNPRRSKKCLCYICARVSVYFVYLMYVKFYSYVYINFIALAHKLLDKPLYMQVTWNPLRTHIIITGFHVHVKRYFSLPNMKYIHVYPKSKWKAVLWQFFNLHSSMLKQFLNSLQAFSSFSCWRFGIPFIRQ